MVLGSPNNPPRAVSRRIVYFHRAPQESLPLVRLRERRAHGRVAALRRNGAQSFQFLGPCRSLPDWASFVLAEQVIHAFISYTVCQVDVFRGTRQNRETRGLMLRRGVCRLFLQGRVGTETGPPGLVARP
eukprot:3156329-Rhodomonas_salina.2